MDAQIAAYSFFMHKTRVIQVHQVVVHQLVVATDKLVFLAVRPARAGRVPQVGNNSAFFGQRGVAHPDPDRFVLLH